MGVLSGFLGGVTLTTAILYLTAEVNRQNRLRQSIMLSQQNAVLLNIVDPRSPQPPPASREVRGGFVEMAKDRWNAEIEGVLRRTYNTDWNQVWANAEAGLYGITSRLLKKADDRSTESTK